jgi:hypothetical protein
MLDVLEEEGHNSFSLGTGHDSVLELAEYKEEENLVSLRSPLQ